MGTNSIACDFGAGHQTETGKTLRRLLLKSSEDSFFLLPVSPYFTELIHFFRCKKSEVNTVPKYRMKSVKTANHRLSGSF